MHKLDRLHIPNPECLLQYDYKTQTWNDLGSECKRTVRSALVRMQGIPEVTTEDSNEYGVRCAYCEGQIHNDGHIEHYRRKNRGYFPELTFNWENLFLACGSKDHCGHFKDLSSSGPYNPDDLLKPDQHDPDRFLYFHSSGAVRVRDGLSPEDALRAKETIRVLGLDNPALTAARSRAVEKYRSSEFEAELREVAAWDDALREEYLQGEIKATQWEGYATTIKHFLQASF